MCLECREESEDCTARDPKTGFWCVRQAGHDGLHESHLDAFTRVLWSTHD